jgi:hypothetical protein
MLHYLFKDEDEYVARRLACTRLGCSVKIPKPIDSFGEHSLNTPCVSLHQIPEFLTSTSLT